MRVQPCDHAGEWHNCLVVSAVEEIIRAYPEQACHYLPKADHCARNELRGQNNGVAAADLRDQRADALSRLVLRSLGVYQHLELDNDRYERQ